MAKHPPSKVSSSHSFKRQPPCLLRRRAFQLPFRCLLLVLALALLLLSLDEQPSCPLHCLPLSRHAHSAHAHSVAQRDHYSHRIVGDCVVLAGLSSPETRSVPRQA